MELKSTASKVESRGARVDVERKQLRGKVVEHEVRVIDARSRSEIELSLRAATAA